MINIKDIIDGHIKEFCSINEELSKSRMQICRKCPIFSKKMGGICDSKLWINPNTDEISVSKQPGYIRGCGCRLNSKTRLPNAVCIADKW